MLLALFIIWLRARIHGVDIESQEVNDEVSNSPVRSGLRF